MNGKYVSAKFWYEGNRTAQAAEDAAQRALIDLGQLPRCVVQSSSLRPEVMADRVASRPQYEVPPHLQHMYTNGSVRN